MPPLSSPLSSRATFSLPFLDLIEVPFLDFTEIHNGFFPTSAKEPISPPSERAISFSDDVGIKDTIHVFDYSPEEKAATWYNVQDLKLFRRARRESVRVWRSQLPFMIDTQRHCFRGLENKMPDGSRRRYTNISRSVLSVLSEQEKQDIDGTIKPELISEVYRKISCHCQAEARDKGLEDYREVLNL
jgi:hypothetical protein